MASTSEAVKEVLVKKSADYAGRPQMHVFYESTLGMFKLGANRPNNSQHFWANNVGRCCVRVGRMQQLPTILDLQCIEGRIQTIRLCQLQGDPV